MATIKLFNIRDVVSEIPFAPVALEKDLQILIEQNMQAFFGVTFLQSEYTTSNGGRIDSLGIDENNCPVIFEYKRSLNENVINQGLFYLDWLMDHKAEFELLVMKICGREMSDKLDWQMPRLICIAQNFTKYDEHAVNQINRNIDLVRYISFDNRLLLFELLNATVEKPKKTVLTSGEGTQYGKGKFSFAEHLANTTQAMQDIYANLENYLLSLGDDISKNELKLYVAFKKMKNIVCVEVYKKILLHLKLDPDTVRLEEGFSKDMRGHNHWGTGDLRLVIHTAADLEKAKPLLLRAYEEN